MCRALDSQRRIYQHLLFLIIEFRHWGAVVRSGARRLDPTQGSLNVTGGQGDFSAA
jgi:hypothetical protein